MGRQTTALREPPRFTFTPPADAVPRRSRFRWLRWLLMGLLLTAIAIASAFYGFMSAIASDLPNLDQFHPHLESNGVVYANDGHTVLAILRADQNRKLVGSHQIAPIMKHALVAIEDRRYYQHGAIDPLGMARAAFVDITTGQRRQGGSTITQQFVKNTYTGGAPSLQRKLVEAALAYQLERRWSKDKILTEYLNTVFFGHGAYGVEMGARTYFGRRARALLPWQAALLAGLVRSPTFYDPVAHPRAARDRRNLVLLKMEQQGYITPIEYADYVTKPLLPVGHTVAMPVARRGLAAYFTQYVEDQLVARYGAARAFGGGLRVYTTIDLHLQRLARRAVSSQLHGVGPSGAMVSIDPRSGQVKAMVGGDDFSHSQFNLATQARRQPGSSFKTFVLLAALREGILPQTEFVSKPQAIWLGAPPSWIVTNDTPNYLGRIPLTTATTYSDNTVFAQLTMQVGADAVRRAAHDAGIVTPIDANPAIGLGGLHIGVSPLEMAHAYATVANGGRRVGGSVMFSSGDGGELRDPSLYPISITKVENANGKIIDRNRPISRQVFAPWQALEVVQMEKSVIRQGTAKLIAGFPRPAAGKTGTTSSFVDAWFAGMTPRLATAVWVGYPTVWRSMRTEFHGKEVFGGTYPALIWRAFMQPALAATPYEDWPYPTLPAGGPVVVDSGTGMRTSPSCPRAVGLVMAYASAPRRWSTCSGAIAFVPDLTGETARAARLTLDRAGLDPQIELVPRYGQTPGKVFLQTPGPGEPARVSTPVHVAVSKPTIWVVEPDVEGRPIAKAVSTLRAQGFAVRLLGGAAGPPGRVLQEIPEPRSLQPRRARVTLIVSGDPPATATGG